MLTLENARGYYRSHWSAHTMDHSYGMDNQTVEKSQGQFSLNINNHKFDCELDSHGHPVVHCRSKLRRTRYTSLKSFLHEFPKLVSEASPIALARLVNFFKKGTESTVIEEPETYKREYKDQLEMEKYSFKLSLSSLMCYGEFKVEEITAPHFEDGERKKLVFYVKNTIPYKVTCECPLEGDESEVRYELLEQV